MKSVFFALAAVSLASPANAACPKTIGDAQKLFGTLRLVASTPEVPKAAGISDYDIYNAGKPGMDRYSTAGLKVFGVPPTEVQSDIIDGAIYSITFFLPGEEAAYHAAFNAAYPGAKFLDWDRSSNQPPKAGELQGALIKTWIDGAQLLCEYK